ncbi:ABC transporter substrate-binding protein [Ammoniphilus sp. 3BR4]|uniref:ABC transporter substrate-binding protein n=1 Tax=Ammoniphilus sp. 3BR4 TaxID=3158265 RepID=UPI0034650155
MKKLIKLTLEATLMLTLAGCGLSQEETASGQPVAQGDKKPVEIEYWYAFGDKIGENNENLVKMFNESQDEVHVKASFQGNYEELHAKTQAAFAAGNPPAVTLNEIASMGVFARNGMTEDLTPFVQRDQVDIDDFIPGLMGNSYIDGKLHGLPYLRSTPLLYLNATMAKEVGLDPAGPKNWKEWEEYARKMTVPGERVGMTMPVGIWFYEGFVKSSGGKMISEDGKTAAFNNAAGVDPVKLWIKMVDEGILKIPTGDDASPLSRQDFANQKSGMYFSSTADLTKILEIAKEGNFELNTTFMPANTTYGVPTGGANMVIVAGLSEEKKEAAWKFIKWMTEKEQTIYASSFTGYLPSRKSAVESEEMKKLYAEKPQFKVAVDQLEYAGPRPMETVYPEIGTIIQDEIKRAILDRSVAPEAAIAEAARKADELLSK